jgi:hypothetical protein
MQTANVQKQRERHPISLHKQTDERVELFEKMIAWCRLRELDPRLYLYVLFKARMWTFAPQLREGHLMSEKMVSRYQKMTEKDCLDGYRQYVYTEKPEFVLDPNKDIIPRAEAMKQRYRNYGQFERCMVETPETTFGFHPKSPTCAACPIQAECKNRLSGLVSFDIQALREGKITVEQARAQTWSQ